MSNYSFLLIVLVLAVSVYAETAEYTVSTRDEFLEAIGPNRTIVIAEGEIMLLIGSPETHANHYVEYDRRIRGGSLLITGVENLTLRGSGKLTTSLMAHHNDAFVVHFVECSGIRIENLVMGHVDDASCMNGVLGFTDCADMTVEDSDIFGCGLEGLTVIRTEGFTFTNSVIRDCSYGIMKVFGSSDMVFEDSAFRDNMNLYGVSMESCSGILFRDCNFGGNTLDLPYSSALLDFSNCDDVTMQDCIIRNNTYEELFSDIDAVTLINVEVDNNQQPCD